jgi:hypothetical protein
VAETVRIPFEEFSNHLQTIFDRVLRDKQTVVVDAGEEGVVTLTSGEPEKERLLPPGKTEEDYQAFLDSFGSWENVDTDRLMRDIRSSRQISRASIDL